MKFYRMPTWFVSIGSLSFGWHLRITIVSRTHILINEMHRVNIHQITSRREKQTNTHINGMKSVRQWNILKMPLTFFCCFSSSSYIYVFCVLLSLNMKKSIESMVNQQLNTKWFSVDFCSYFLWFFFFICIKKILFEKSDWMRHWFNQN